MQLVSTSFQPTAEIFTHRSFCSNTCFIFPIILLAFYLFLDFFQKRGYLVKKTDWTPQKLSVEVPESKLRSKKVEIAPRSKERRRPIPRPHYTIEELLAKVPEPKVEVRKPGLSEETETGPPVGREVW